MALTKKQLAQLRADGVPEDVIAGMQTDYTAKPQLDQGTRIGLGKKSLPMGVAGYDDNGNPIIDPSQLTAATKIGFDQELPPPDPELQEAHPELYKSIDDMAQATDENGNYIYTDEDEELYPGVASDRADAERQLATYDSNVKPVYTGSVDTGGPDTPVEDNRHPLERMSDFAIENEIWNMINEPPQQADPYGAFLSGMAGAKHTPYAGGLQSLADMFGGGSQMAQQMAIEDLERKDQFNRLRMVAMGGVLDRRDKVEDRRLRREAADRQRNPWMKVDGGLYNWETDKYKKIDDPKNKYMKVGDGLFNLETETFETLPNNGTRPEWLPGHFESVKDYNQTAKSINEEARKDTKNFNIKREYFNNTRAIVQRNPDYGNYSVAEANALVKNLEKMLDPASAVLSGESEAYQQGAAMIKQAKKIVSQAEKGGTTLTRDQIKSIVDTTNTVYKAMQDDVNKVYDRYGRRYETQGIRKDSQYQFLPMLPGIGEKVLTEDQKRINNLDPTAHGLNPFPELNL